MRRINFLIFSDKYCKVRYLSRAVRFLEVIIPICKGNRIEDLLLHAAINLDECAGTYRVRNKFWPFIKHCFVSIKHLKVVSQSILAGWLLIQDQSAFKKLSFNVGMLEVGTSTFTLKKLHQMRLAIRCKHSLHNYTLPLWVLWNSQWFDQRYCRNCSEDYFDAKLYWLSKMLHRPSQPFQYDIIVLTHVTISGDTTVHFKNVLPHSNVA